MVVARLGFGVRGGRGRFSMAAGRRLVGGGSPWTPGVLSAVDVAGRAADNNRWEGPMAGASALWAARPAAPLPAPGGDCACLCPKSYMCGRL
jgi:hypothetical protein